MRPLFRWCTTLLCALAALGALRAAEESVEVDEGVRARIVDGRHLVIEALPEQGEGYLALAERLCGGASRAEALRAANGNGEPQAGTPVLVPWELARPEYRYLALRAVFPADRFDDGAWRHQPFASPLPSAGLGLWQVATWFTGDGTRWEAIAAANGLADPLVPRDATIRVPEEFLLPLFRPVAMSADGLLSYRSDERGPYAEYRLRKGEALYSAVVLRFTGVLESDGEDEDEAEGYDGGENGDPVQSMVDVIVERSGIKDVRDIAIGFPVKIPLEVLASPYLPPNEPRAVIARLRDAEIAAIEMPPRPRSLDGVHIIIDPGHGGADVGAMLNGVWESDYVYDVAARVRRMLIDETGAKVHFTVKDTQHGYEVFEARKIPQNKREVVQTTPAHPLDAKSRIRPGVNLRWYLANHIYRGLLKDGVAPEKIVFVSLHADSLHESVRGAMVYVPGSRYRGSSHAVKGREYARYREYSKGPVNVTRQEKLRDEKISTRLGEALLSGFPKNDLLVHHDRPLRDHVVRKIRARRAPQRWVPAVLRGNAVPAKVLLELVNLNNREDAKVMADPKGRERLARAVVDGLHAFYTGP